MQVDGSGRGGVAIRYFSTVTPKDEGSVVFWPDAPETFTGEQLRAVLDEKHVPLSVSAPAPRLPVLSEYMCSVSILLDDPG